MAKTTPQADASARLSEAMCVELVSKVGMLAAVFVWPYACYEHRVPGHEELWQVLSAGLLDQSQLHRTTDGAGCVDISGVCIRDCMFSPVIGVPCSYVLQRALYAELVQQLELAEGRAELTELQPVLAVDLSVVQVKAKVLYLACIQ